MVLVATYRPLTRTGLGETVDHTTGETRFVADCKMNPVESYPAALAGHVKITLAPEGMVVSCGSGNERLNTVP